jgi:hypothetical protein
MKNYPNKIAKEFIEIAKCIEENNLFSADIKITKEDDGNYIILGQYITKNTGLYYPNLIKFYPITDFTKQEM